MDIAKAFTFVLEDKNWIKKLGIGALLTLFIWLIVPFFTILGYGIETARHVASRREPLLPEWNFGEMTKDGFSLFLAMLVYMIPVVVVLVFFGLFSADRATGGGASTSFNFNFGQTLLGAVFNFLTIPIVLQYVKHDSIGACFDFGEIADTFRNSGMKVLIAVATVVGMSIVFNLLSVVLLLIPCLGWVALLAVGLAYLTFSQAVAGHLNGQILYDDPSYASYSEPVSDGLLDDSSFDDETSI